MTFVVRSVYIPSDSMMPTLRANDVLLVNEFAYRFAAPRRGDIAVFKPPIPSADDYIKRVVAVPGDTLRIARGRVYVDGRRLHERYVLSEPQYNLSIRNFGIEVEDRTGDGYEPLEAPYADIPPKSAWQNPMRVPKGFYFVMGDNRNDSMDSHVWGFVRQSAFVGRAFMILWPAGRIRILN